MTNTLFKTETYEVKKSLKAALLFAGYKGKISSFDKTIKTLNEHGFTVFAYEHDPNVLKKGNPHDLINMLDDIHKDVFMKIKNYKHVICLGVSLGVGIGFSIQRVEPEKIEYGIYAGAGISPSGSIFESLLFYFVRKAYIKNDYDKDSIFKLWEEHEIIPSKPVGKDARFTIVLGKRDRIVKYRSATETYNAWINAGEPIEVITKNYLGHLGTIRWYKNNLGSLLEESEKRNS